MFQKKVHQNKLFILQILCLIKKKYSDIAIFFIFTTRMILYVNKSVTDDAYK